VRGAENAGMENGVETAGAYRRGGKCRSGKCKSDKVWKAIRRKYSKVPDEISANYKVPDERWLSWLSCLLVAKRDTLGGGRYANDVTENPLHLYSTRRVSEFRKDV